MNKNFLILDNFLEIEKYRKYFSNLYAENNFKSSLTYIMYDTKSFFDFEIINLSKIFCNKFNLPPIEYFFIFKHIRDQPVHIDGKKSIRFCSLNLALKGYENTKLNFYKIKKNALIKHKDAHYFNNNDVILDNILENHENWTLVNSSVPHAITNVDPNNPRYTICFRFKFNPTFESIKNKLI